MSEDWFTGSKFGDDAGNTFSVEKVIDFAKQQPRALRSISSRRLEHNREFFQGNEQRMQAADTSHPLLVVKEGFGRKSMSIADGLNRYEKLRRGGAKKVNALVVKKKDIMHLADNNDN